MHNGNCRNNKIPVGNLVAAPLQCSRSPQAAEAAFAKPGFERHSSDLPWEEAAHNAEITKFCGVPTQT